MAEVGVVEVVVVIVIVVVVVAVAVAVVAVAVVVVMSTSSKSGFRIGICCGVIGKDRVWNGYGSAYGSGHGVRVGLPVMKEKLRTKFYKAKGT